MPEVKLTYYHDGGRKFSEGQYTTTAKTPKELLTEVRTRNYGGSLPGLFEGQKADIVGVNCKELGGFQLVVRRLTIEELRATIAFRELEELHKNGRLNVIKHAAYRISVTSREELLDLVEATLPATEGDNE